MANFTDSFSKVIYLEGSYDNNPNDTGGETYCGVSRNNFPKWEGWAIIDQYKSKPNFPKSMSNDTKLNELIKSWYKSEFWDVYGLDQLSYQAIAFEIFEQAVNLGRGKCTEHIQSVCNGLNYKGKFGTDLVIDGKIGNNTRSRMNEILTAGKDYAQAFVTALNGMQIGHYIRLALSNSGRSDYRQFFKGWILNRGVGTIVT